MSDQEMLLNKLIEDYADEVIKIIEYGQFISTSNLDLDGLNSSLKSLDIEHQEPYLSADEWFEVIFELAPDVYNRIFYKAAA